MTNRYLGKPLLRLLECYVLDAIGELDLTHADMLKTMEPKLEHVYDMKGTWREIVSAQMELPEALPKKIQNLWKVQLDMAVERGVTLIPNDFAMAFVDQNFNNSVVVRS